jgi:hypothetical protein
MRRSSDILALACKEAIPEPWTGGPWPTNSTSGRPTQADNPPGQVPLSRSVPSKNMPHEGVGDEGALQGLDCRWGGLGREEKVRMTSA